MMENRKGSYSRRAARVLIAALLIAALLCGCSPQVSQKPAQPAAPAQTSLQPEAPDGPAAPDAPDEPPKPEKVDGVVRVSSAAELIEAIDNDTTVIIEPGYYDLTPAIKKICAGDLSVWNNEHAYVNIQEVYDGYELIISGVSGLAIKGGGESFPDTVVTVEPRYANVLTFSGCSGTALENLTLGHTNGGACSGGVVYLDHSSDTRLSDMDLYGCGEIGITAYYSEMIYAEDCVIRDCSYLSADLYECGGRVEFRGCSLKGSGYGISVSECGEADILFKECSFGANETDSLYGIEGANYENCSFTGPGPFGDVDLGGYRQFDWSDVAGTEWTLFQVLDYDKGWIEPPADMEMLLEITESGGCVIGPSEFVWSDSGYGYYLEISRKGSDESCGQIRLLNGSEASNKAPVVEVNLEMSNMRFVPLVISAPRAGAL